MHQFLVGKKSGFEDAIAHLRDEMAGLRTGRAHPGLVEHVVVEAYGTQSPLKALAMVSIPESRTLQIEAWDAGIVKDIERALSAADLGASPHMDGKIIRLVLPTMTEETRKKMVRLMKEKVESARVSLRQSREDIRKEVSAMEKDKKISEDERFKIFDELDRMTKEFTDMVEKISEEKEREIMTV
ncbi:ribosome recycling factor [Candidatus Uhrbacteria bacterium]|nr:ribosome recycling factor [Candidatus Uhrbacteria bacterium]